MKRLAIVIVAAACAWSAKGGGLRLECGAGVVEVYEGGAKLAFFNGISLSYGKLCFFSKGKETPVEGGWEVTYAPPDDFPAELTKPVAKGRFTCAHGVVSVRFAISHVATNDNFRADLCMFGRQHANGLTRGALSRAEGYWVRDPGGGQPWEERLGGVLGYTNAVGRGVKYIFAKEMIPNPDWASPLFQHLLFRPAAEGEWVSDFKVFSADPSQSDLAVALVAEGRAAQVTLRTAKTYNWFEDPAEPLAFAGEVLNAQAAPRNFQVSWWVRDFTAGGVVASGARSVALAFGASETITVAFNPPEARGLYLVEMSARDETDGREAFARTSLARLPPHRFKATPANSPFGLAAYWPIPDEESVQRLMDRMGVMWIRGGDTRKQHPPRVAKHISGGKETLKLKGDEREKWIVDQLETCRTNHNEYWEFCNELNMTAPGGIALKTHGIGKAVLAPAYAEFVKDIARVKKERGYRVRLLSLGLAGHDSVFLQRLNELGVWAYLDGICVHPGRGNFTVDYPYLIPERVEGKTVKTDDPDTTERLAYSSYWNYLGTVRGAQRQIRELGEKPLWLTEIYAPTFPNSWWEDSLRCSAENVIMTYAFIKADGVACGMWYQLFDTVWYDKLGINSAEREYFFGLLNRDLSFKPALMAYCTIAEALDEAEFLGWLEVGRDTSHAMAFETPRGTMVVAWDRSEGFILNRDHVNGRRYASPEPWVEQWTKTVDVSFPVVDEAISINVIGQTRRLPSQDGKSTVRLTGAPIIVYGLDRNRLAFYAKTEDNLGTAAAAVFDSRFRNKVIPESSKIK